MGVRTVSALAAVAVLLGGYLIVDRRGDPPEGESSRLLPKMRREAYQQIRIERGGQPTITLRREEEETWHLARPLEARADLEAVERLLSAVEFLAPLREVPPEASPAQLGLAPPQVRLSLIAPAGHLTVKVGRADPSGTGAYVAVDEERYVVGRAILDAVDREVAAFRERRLLQVDDGLIERVELRRSDGSYLLERGPRGWQVTQGGAAPVRAAAGRVQRLLAALSGLRVARFLPAAGPTSGARLLVSGAGEQQELRFGRECESTRGARIIAWRGAGSWLRGCVAGEGLAPVLEPGALEERALTTVREPDLAGVAIRAGMKTLRLERDGATWRIGSGARAEAARIRAWLAELARARGEIQRASPAEIDRLFPRAGTATIELTLEGGGVEQLQVGPERDGRVPVQRGDERAVLWVSAAVRDLAAAHARRFRHRRVLWLSPHRMTRVVRSRAGKRVEAVARVAGEWRVEQPVELAADPEHMKRLCATLASLRASRFLEPGDLPHGSPLRIRIHAGGEPLDAPSTAPADEVVVLELWDDPLNGCAARVVSGAAPAPGFALGERPCVTLTTLSATRRPLHVERDHIDAVRIAAGERRLTVRRQGGRWVRSESSEPLRSATAVELLEALAGLQAGRPQAYGTKPGGGGEPVADITLSSGGAEERRFRIYHRGVVVPSHPVVYELPADVSKRLVEAAEL